MSVPESPPFDTAITDAGPRQPIEELTYWNRWDNVSSADAAV